MKAAELRIGNWIQDNNANIYQIENGWQIDEGDELFGIPLTQKWMREFGFKKNHIDGNSKIIYSDFYSNCRQFRIYYPRKRKSASMHCKPDVTEWYPEIVTDIKYVHQLQNLYLALTEKELIIKTEQ